MTAVAHQFLFTSATADATVAFTPAAHVLHPIIALTPGNDCSGTIRFQGRMSSLHEWFDLHLVNLTEGDGNAAPFSGLVHLTAHVIPGQESPTSYYRVVDYYPEMQAILVVTGGTLTSAEWWAHENDNYAPRQVVAALDPSVRVESLLAAQLAVLQEMAAAQSEMMAMLREELAEEGE